MSKAWKRGRFLPPSVTMPGFTTSWTAPDYKHNKPGGASVGFDSMQSALRDRYFNVLNQGLDTMMAPKANVGGFGAISPEMYNEFLASNNTAGPNPFYDQTGFDSLLGQYKGMAGTAADEAMRMLSGGTEGNMTNWLNLLRQQASGQENNLLQGNADKQFMKGILGSTAGSYQTQGIVGSINQADLGRQLQAYGLSQDAINQALQRATATGGMFTGMEADAANRMFQTNNTIYNRATDRFNRASNLFGMGMGQQQVDFARGLQTAGAGAGFLANQDAMMQQMLNTMFGAGAMQSNANNNATMAAAAGNNNGMLGGLLNSAIGSAGNIAGSYVNGMGAARAG